MGTNLFVDYSLTNSLTNFVEFVNQFVDEFADEFTDEFIDEFVDEFVDVSFFADNHPLWRVGSRAPGAEEVARLRQEFGKDCIAFCPPGSIADVLVTEIISQVSRTIKRF